MHVVVGTLPDFFIQHYWECGWIGITPFDPENIQTVAYELHLDKKIRVVNRAYAEVDPEQENPDLMLLQEIPPEGFLLYPGQFLLGATVERISLPDNIQAYLHGKSSWGRLGINPHSTAGLIDPGFDGTITLEISSDFELPVRLRAGQRIAQLSFEVLPDPVKIPYGDPRLNSKYQGQTEPGASAYHKNPKTQS